MATTSADLGHATSMATCPAPQVQVDCLATKRFRAAVGHVPYFVVLGAKKLLGEGHRY